MFKGFYNLASGMITHGKNLDVISNNMANVSTTGFKADCFTGQTFDEVMYTIVGNKNKNYEDIGSQSYATVPSQLYTDYSQSSFDVTGMPLILPLMMTGTASSPSRQRTAWCIPGHVISLWTTRAIWACRTMAGFWM